MSMSFWFRLRQVFSKLEAESRVEFSDEVIDSEIELALDYFSGVLATVGGFFTAHEVTERVRSMLGADKRDVPHYKIKARVHDLARARFDSFANGKFVEYRLSND